MKRALVLLVSIFATSVLQAQQTPDDNSTYSEAKAIAKASSDTENAVADPTLKSGGRGTAPAVSFQFSKDDQTATAQIGGGMGAGRRWGLTVSGPISKSSDQTILATNEGLNSGFNAELLVRNIFLQKKPKLSALELNDICSRFLPPDLRIQRRGDHISCSRDELTNEGKLIFDAKAFDPVWTLGGSAKVGRSTFDYADPVTFVDHSDTHDGSSFAITAGRFQTGPLAAALYYVGGSFRHESAFIGNDSENVCTPIDASTSTHCRDIAIGAPMRRSTNLLQLEARSFIGDNVGLAPRVTYETKQHEWSIDLPIYLRDLGNGAGAFNGGVSVGWDSKSHGVVVSLFVGALPKITR
jgi:hypothetical protein